MSTWILVTFLVVSIFHSAYALRSTIRFNRKLKSSLFHDWGPQTNRIVVWMGTALLPLLLWIARDVMPEMTLVLVSLACGMISIQNVLETIPHQGIYEDGVFLMQEIMWMVQRRFILWSEIQAYCWEEQGRLIINPGWHAITCRITPEMVDDLQAALTENCPDAELEMQHAAP